MPNRIRIGYALEMPDKPSWYERVPEILPALEASRVPFLDRLTIESVFQLGRRQAIRLMGRFGGYQVGRSYLVDRSQVIEHLQTLRATGDVAWAIRRKERLLRVLREERPHLRSRAVHIPVSETAANLEHLPSGIELEPGCLTVRFAEPLELLEKLVELSRALALDYDGFERKYRSRNTHR